MQFIWAMSGYKRLRKKILALMFFFITFSKHETYYKSEYLNGTEFVVGLDIFVSCKKSNQCYQI